MVDCNGLKIRVLRNTFIRVSLIRRYKCTGGVISINIDIGILIEPYGQYTG